MSSLIGRSSGTERRYRVPNYSVTNQTHSNSGNGPLTKLGATTYPSTGQTIGSPNSTKQAPPSSTSGTMPNTSTIPGRGTTSPSTSTPTTPGTGATPQVIPSPATTPRTTPNTGSRMNPITGTVTTPVPNRGTTPTPGTGTGTSPMRPGTSTTPTPGMGTGTSPMRPGNATTPAPGMGTGTSPMRPGNTTTPTPGMGTGTSPMRPGNTTTPAPGMGTGTSPMRPGNTTTPTPGMGTGTSPMRPGNTTTPGTGTNPARAPFIYGTYPESPATPNNGNTVTEPSGRQPLNPQSMAPSGMTMPGSNSVAPQPQMNINTPTPVATPQAPGNISAPMQEMPQPMQNPTPPASNRMAPQGNMQTPQVNMPIPQGNAPAPQGNMPYGMQPGAPQEIPYYFNPTFPYAPDAMPYMNYPPYQGIPNMYLPNSNTYQVPMGIPLFPLYGYDNSADLDRDLEYMKQLYPKTARTIQKEIEDECDKMEYDGSMMFDEYPDKEHLDRLTDHIYERIKQVEDEPQVEMNSLYFYPPRRNSNYLRDIVSLLLLSEIFNRRRRYRSRKRWF